MIHIRLPNFIRQQLKALAALENKSLTQLIGEIAEDYLEKKGITLK